MLQVPELRCHQRLLLNSGTSTGTIVMDIAMSSDGSNYSFSGQVTINGEQFDIEEFAGELL